MYKGCLSPTEVRIAARPGSAADDTATGLPPDVLLMVPTCECSV
jgi:hypothetical protein